MEIALVALASVFAFVGFLSLGRTSFAILRTARRWTTADFPDGALGRVIGRVRLIGEPLQAPLTGRPCVCFVAEVYSEFSPGGVYREIHSVPFVIEDDAGRAMVDPAHAGIDLRLEITGACGRAIATDAERAMFARRRRGHALKLEDWTFREAIVAPGAMICVIGAGEREPDPEAPIDGGAIYREMPTRLRLFARRGYPLAISDRAI